MWDKKFKYFYSTNLKDNIRSNFIISLFISLLLILCQIPLKSKTVEIGWKVSDVVKDKWTYTPSQSIIHSPTNYLTHSLTHFLIHYLSHLLTHSLPFSLTTSLSLFLTHELSVSLFHISTFRDEQTDRHWLTLSAICIATWGHSTR